MATNAANRTNIFSFIPKSISSEVFLVWLINYLDSDCKYGQYKQSFFDNLLLKRDDKGKLVSEISINRQSNNMETVLSFHFNGTDERHDILLLFVDKESNMVRPEQLDRYKWIYPNCYRFFYYKLGYINSQEKKEVSQAKYEVINADMMSSTLEKMIDLHPLIKMYYDYITCTFVDAINSYYERIFVKHDYDILESADAQKYLCDAIVEKMTEQNVSYLEIRNGSSYGRPWTQIDFVRKEYGYSERLFWRVDIRSGKYYVRLNQYAEPSEKEVDYKMKRLEVLRNEATNIVGTMPDLHVGKVENKAIKESEVLIFFLEDNNLERLLEAIPKISRHMIDAFQRLG